MTSNPLDAQTAVATARRALLCVGLAALLAPAFALAQDTVSGMLSAGSADFAAIKRNAEAGDAAAQVALGNAEAQYYVGNILLFGRHGIPADRAVKSNIPDGIRWTYMAATNGNTQAYFNMAKVLSEGRGTPASQSAGDAITGRCLLIH